MLGWGASAASAQTARQWRQQSRWDDSDAPRPRGDGLLRREMLYAHNRARDAIGVAPLVWDAALADDADRYALELADTRAFRHSRKEQRASPQGENLWMGTRDAFTYAEMTASWAGERRYYRAAAFPDISSTGLWQDVGHYTQMVWSTTTRVGCALESNETDDYLVCRYSPPGNVFGRTVMDGQPKR
jgi:hypothetical protein